ncbi:MAG: efflux RND transporter periplasmic adaptor subunit [Planctomycetota bacterium]|nr:MAG: efflux RND transporter periplasmic adaptor subunit [Planctomycetota bacterium]
MLRRVRGRQKKALATAGLLGGSLAVALGVLVLGAEEEEAWQRLEVSYARELSRGRFLVRPLPPRTPGKTLSVAKITRYPFGFAVVETASGERALPKKPVAVRTLRLSAKAVRRKVVAFGAAEAERDATVVAEAAGTVREMLFALGEEVAAGDPLVRLDPRDAELALAAAEARLEQAQGAQQRARTETKNLLAQLLIAREALDARARERERWQVLAARETASRDRADQAENAWRAAAAEHARVKGAYEAALAGARESEARVSLAVAQRDQARLALARATVRAPFAARVAERYVSVGDRVAPGTPVARLVSSDRLRVRVHVWAGDAARVARGAAASVSFPAARDLLPAAGTLPAYPGAAAGFLGRVEGVAAAADPRSRKVAVDVSVEDPRGVLRAGLFARVEIDGGVVPGALLIPDSAVISSEEGRFVYVVEGDCARRRQVLLGARQGEARLLREGLSAPVELVVSGVALLYDGAPVRRLED